MIRPAALLAALAAFASAQAAAAQQPAGLAGVWDGTIGSYHVRACFMDSNSFARGSYFYYSTRQPIGIRRSEDGKRWIDSYTDKGSEAFAIARQGYGTITGTWTKGATSLPVTLERVNVAAGEGDGHCGSPEFIAPLVSPPRIVSRPARKGGFAYTRLKLDVGKAFPDVEITSFSFPSVRPGDAAINRQLKAHLAPSNDDLDYVGCMSGSLALGGHLGELHQVREPAYVSREFLAVRESGGGFCGGPHPDNWMYHVLFDRVSGKRLVLERWLAPKGFAIAEPTAEGWIDTTITPALRKIAARRIDRTDADCRDVVAEAERWDVTVTATGFVLSPLLPRVVQACGDSAALTFAEIAPFLSVEGRAGLARLRKR